jgi:hypothetical protein
MIGITVLQINKTLRRWSLRRNSLGRICRVLFGIEGIFYLVSYLLHPALASSTRSSSWPQRSWYARWNCLVLIQKDLFIRKFQIFYYNSARHPLNIPQQHPHGDLRLNCYQVLSCDRLPNYYDEGLLKFLLKVSYLQANFQ